MSFYSFVTRAPARATLITVRWVSNAPKRRSGNRAARLGLAKLLREKKRWRASYEQFERVATDSVGLSKPAPPTPRQDVTVMEPYIRDIANFVHLHERVRWERGPLPPRFWTSFYRTPEPKPASDPNPSSARVMAAPFVREYDQGQDEDQDDAEGEGDGSTPPPLARDSELEPEHAPLARPSWAHERVGWEQGPLPPWFTNSLHRTPEPASDPDPSPAHVMAAALAREDQDDAQGEEDGHTPLPPPRYPEPERPTLARPSWARAIDDHDHPPPRQYFTQFTSLYRPSWASSPMPTFTPPHWHFRPSLSSDPPPPPEPAPPERPRDKEKRRKLHRRELLDRYLKKREILPVMGYGLPTFKTGPSASPHVPAWHPPLPPSALVLEKLNAILERLGPKKTIPSKKRIGELMAGAKLELEILYYSERFTLAHLPPFGSGWTPLDLGGRFCEAILKARGVPRASGSGKRRLWIWNTRMLLMRLEELGGRMTPELEAVVGGLCRKIEVAESEIWEGIFGREAAATLSGGEGSEVDTRPTSKLYEGIFPDATATATLGGSEDIARL
ncbi:hypothetical protein EXIGLDRAFT_278537 [Exidia glandulosa HHB12029]|uniref:Uncharacterized protein n=1 Tax=Exidia glandulosa HHB12029 TaxID=1314781 RepID=A0A165DK96_EXIGL|nr:hypothetical protein EXIGLDRAFT_278537 [Exidia glandulosa HHB12029]